MARFITVLLLTAAVSCAALYVFPWWVPMPVAFLLVLLLPLRGGAAFLAAGTGAALTYFIMALLADLANNHILSTKMALLFHVPSFIFMLLLTALSGFITAGLGGWAGALLRRFTRRNAQPAI